METKIYRLRFRNAHFGDGYLNTSVPTFTASRLFSALCLEALKNDCLKEWMTVAENDEFKISDAFPYQEQPYLPVPVGEIALKMDLRTLVEDNQANKAVRALRFVPVDRLLDLLNGKVSAEELLKTEMNLAQQTVLMKKGADPYEVGVTEYRSSLYVLASSDPLFEQLMTGLQFSGLGGKRTSGYGRFEMEILPVPSLMGKMLADDKADKQVLLTTSLPNDNELGLVVDDANYRLVKSSGFTYSPDTSEQLRKEDLYKFASGSVFTRRYAGVIADVRPKGFAHPVWNYAKGMFYGLEVAK